MQKLCKLLCISPGVTLETLSGRIYGSKMKRIVLVVISGSQLCAFIGSFILATDLLHHSFCGNEIKGISCVERSTIALVLAVFNLIMVFIPNLKAFAYISSLSVIFQFFALLMVFLTSTKLFLMKDDYVSIFKSELFYTNWANSIKTLGIVLYIFQRITFYLPIKSNYNQVPNFHNFYVRSMNSVFFYIFVISSPCYFLFFTSGQEIVFQNFDSSFVIIEIFKLAYVMVIFLSNPINLFPIYNSIYSMNFFNSLIIKSSTFKAYLLKLFVRILISCLGILVGVFVNSFVKFCSFVGAFFFSFLGLILPGILLWEFITKESSEVDYRETLNEPVTKNKNFFRIEKFSIGFIIFVGCCIFGIATYDSISDLLSLSSQPI
jgi:hypothetical protein